jgi:hypothetical protein
VTYSSAPCAAGDERQLHPVGGPIADDRARAQARFQREQSAQLAKEAPAMAQAPLDPSAAGASNAAATRADDPRANERVLTHSADGWDYKRRGLVDAEAQARDTGVAPALTGADWESEKTLVHAQKGWEYRTGAQQVQGIAERANREAARKAEIRAHPTYVDRYGTVWTNIGSGMVVSTRAGRACPVAGGTIINC